MYQQKFNGQILKTDGKQIAQDMKEKMELIFNENIDALRVSLDSIKLENDSYKL